MSHIPNSAMRHAIAHDEPEAAPSKTIAERLKAAPIGAIIAGVAVVGGIAAAAAVPFLRATPKPAGKRRRAKASSAA